MVPLENSTEIHGISWTGERYVPELKGSIQLEHLHRYALACEYVQDKVVLDIACGEGYGSAMLAESAKRVWGVDIAEDIITYAKTKYKKVNLQFKIGSCAEIPLKDSSVDMVVSFETIEHHSQHEAMMSEVKRVLKPGGAIIISSPDKHTYSDLRSYDNQYHVKELYYDEFKNLLKVNFNNVVIYGQRIVYGSGIFPEDSKGRMFTYDLKEMGLDAVQQARFKGIARPLYFIALASDSELPIAIGSVLEQPIHKSDTFLQYSAELTSQAQQLRQIITHQDQTIAEKDQAIAHYREELYSVYTSRSWRYTTPLRKIGTLIRRVLRLPHKPRIRAVINRAYFMLPAFIRKSRLTENLKNRFKSKEMI